MQSKAAKLFSFAVIALAVFTSRPSSAQQPAPPSAKQLRSNGNTTVYQDTQWSPDEDLQLLKSDLRSQKKAGCCCEHGPDRCRGGEILACL